MLGARELMLHNRRTPSVSPVVVPSLARAPYFEAKNIINLRRKEGKEM